jgi:hypothetical protein
MKKKKTINGEIHSLKMRNTRVERSVTWETSLTRKLIVSVLTYFFMTLFFYASDFPNPFVNAIVPTLGFILSTLSLNLFKKLWIKHAYKK